MPAFRSIRVLLCALLFCLMPVASFAGVFVSITIAPPVLPVYAQPICPVDGYLWTPGYWNYGPAGYYWVPGVWVQPPRIGVLWTPPYWGWSGGAYFFHAGYWGPHVGFYGGINYGFGYSGAGFGGGYWSGGRFAYNTAVTRVNTTIIHNTYNRTVVNNTFVNNRVSYNGGAGGVNARPSPQELAANREQHLQPTANQASHQQAAAQDRSQWASNNQGRPGMGTVNDRRAYQQDRIANGVRSGQLAPRETANIERREANINNNVRNDRAATNGRLTPNERRNVNQQQNAASRQINRDKHNEREAPR